MKQFVIYQWQDMLKLLLLALLYTLVAIAVLEFFAANHFVSVFWPPSGLAVAALVHYGIRYWPSLWLGATIATFYATHLIGISALIGLGNAMEAVACALMLKNCAKFCQHFIKPRDYYQLGLKAAGAALIGASIGGNVLFMTEHLPLHEVGHNIWHWWQGDFLGIMLLTPLFLIWRQPPDWFKQQHKIEIIICLTLAWLWGQMVMLDWPFKPLQDYAKGYTLFVFVIWSALCAGRHAVTLVVVMFAIQALIGAALGVGYFSKDLLVTELSSTWLYTLLLSITGMSLALSIAQRHQVQVALQDSEAELRAVVDNAPVGIWLVGVDGRYRFLNKTFCDAVGIAEEKFLATTSLPELLGAEIAQRCLDSDRQCLAAEKAYISHENLPFIDGKLHNLEITKSKLFDSHGAVTGVIGIAVDVTEREQIQAKLRQSEATFKSLFEQMPDPAWIINREHLFVQLNAAAASIMGYQHPTEFYPQHPSQLSPLLQPDGESSYSKAERYMQLAEQQGVYRFEWIHKRKDAGLFPVEVTLSAIEVDGKPALYCLWRDISAYKQTEHELRANEQKLNTILDNVTAYIYLKDIQGRYLYANYLVRQLFKASLEEIVGFGDEKFFDAETSRLLRQNDSRVLEHGEILKTEESRLSLVSDGTAADYWVVKIPLRREDGSIYGLCGISTDISELKRAEQKLIESHRQYEQLTDQIPVGVYRFHIYVDGTMRFEYVSTQFCRLLEVKAEQVLADASLAFLKVHPDELDEFVRLNQQVGQTLEPFYWQGRMVIGKQTRWMRIESVPNIQSDGSSIWSGIITDINEAKQVQLALQESEQRWQFALEGSDAGVWDWDFLNSTVHFSAHWKHMFGYGDGEIGTDLSEWTSRLHPDDVTRMKQDLEDYFTGKQRHYRNEHRLLAKDGTWKWVLSRGMLVSRTQEGKPLRMVGTHTDISERKRNEEALQLASLVYQNSHEGMTVTDENGLIIAVNPAFSQITGYTAAEVMGKNPDLFRSEEQNAKSYSQMQTALRASGHWEGEVWSQRKNGQNYVEWLRISSIYHADGRLHRRVALFSDITKKKESEDLIWRQANFDPLTNLPNRRMFQERLNLEVKKVHRAEQLLALMFIDLDRFKEVNDTLGHEMGDILLQEAARRLTGCVRETDTVARLGGDEFTVILAPLARADLASVERIVRTILEKLCQPFCLRDEKAYISASVGIAFYPDDSDTVDKLIKSADQAMYASKNEGRNRYRYFMPFMQEEALERLKIANDLRDALALQQFQVCYQPIVNLTTQKIVKAEALIRWQHPERGLVSPANFISVAEENGSIVEIGNWMFDQACQQVLSWRQRYNPEFQISINKSPIQFQNDNTNHAGWFERMQALNLPGQSIVVEITEGLLLDANTNVTAQLLKFRDEGVQVSLDDFGTGYSSLAYLKKFDIDYLKIDQSFVLHLESDSDDLVLCEAIVMMAHKLGIKVVAEGIETAQQRDLLAAIGCDYGQGYFFAKPLPALEFELLLTAQAGGCDESV